MKHHLYCLTAALILPLQFVSCSIYKTHTKLGSEERLSARTASMQGLHYFLPKSHLLISGAYQQTKDKDGKVTATHYVINVKEMRRADPDAPQFAQITENIFYDEDSTIKVEKGLLTSSLTKPKDQTPEIIKTLVGTYLDLAKLGMAGAKTRFADIATQDGKFFEPFSLELDPFADDFQAKLDGIKSKGWVVGIRGNAKSPPQKPVASRRLKTKRSADEGETYPGLAYRRPTPVMLSFTPITGYKPKVEGTEFSIPDHPEYIVPDPETMAYMPVRRGFMTQRVTTVNFSEGMPQDIALTQPSPVLALVKLPADLVKMVGDALPAIIKVNTPAAGPSELDVLKSQNALLEQKIKQIEFETKLQQLQPPSI